MRVWFRLRLAVLSALLLGAACATPGAVGSARVSSPFSERDALLFEDGVDFVADPGALTGRWADDWAAELRDRVAASDLIAHIVVTTLADTDDPSQQRIYRLVGEVKGTWKGSAPSNELSMSSAPSARGYVSLDRNKARLVRSELVAFIKWYQKPEGGVAGHFHLSAASAQVVARLRAEIERSEPPKTTIVTRTSH